MRLGRQGGGAVVVWVWESGAVPMIPGVGALLWPNTDTTVATGMIWVTVLWPVTEEGSAKQCSPEFTDFEEWLAPWKG